MTQYDQETKQSLPVSAHFSKLKNRRGFLESEIGFIDFILAPLFEVANTFSEGQIENIMEKIRHTRSVYEQELQEIKKTQP